MDDKLKGTVWDFLFVVTCCMHEDVSLYCIVICSIFMAILLYMIIDRNTLTATFVESKLDVIAFVAFILYKGYTYHIRVCLSRLTIHQKLLRICHRVEILERAT